MKLWKILLSGTLLSAVVVSLLGFTAPAGFALPPDPGNPGCTKTNPNGTTVGFQPQSCTDFIPDLNCSLVAGGTETVDRGLYAGKTFNYDVSCNDVFGGPATYHYKATESVYKEGLNGYVGTQDTFIRPDAPDSVMPSYFAMEVVAHPFGIPWLRGVIRFPHALPSTARVLSADLGMVCQEAVPNGGVPGHLAGGGTNVEVFGLLKQFNQNEATWNQAASGLTWEVPGAEGATDRQAAADASQFIGTKCNGDGSLPAGAPIVPTEYRWNVLSSYLYQRSLGLGEYGWVFFTPDTDGDAVRFFTNEMSAQYAPSLTVKYIN